MIKKIIAHSVNKYYRWEILQGSSNVVWVITDFVFFILYFVSLCAYKQQEYMSKNTWT